MKIGHFDNFIILVTGILRDKKGEILLIKRSNKNKTFKGFWQLPEGKIEFGEQPEKTLARELKEELGYRLISARSVTANSAVVVFQGVSYHVLRVVLEAKWKGKITLSDEHQTYRWVSINKALKMPNLVDGTKEILSTLKPV
ncbi:MAG: NUDIX hydrolase [Patescibacteria group bacterium]